ncbi:N-acetyltransferase [Staphylococcus simiae]|uniref:N-acetyltransferase n=1 Tax=Staphylococcus simiae TaxID=308354 RepID=UPI001A96E9B3|nr:N-acetyltransferase [Staphylococcus simiae]MBO1199714.1 N-acetyltransferase [Staphylococcus simiae]MBO1201465.1 N-acetyltransferase [Staphylococcus simiae]MBO1203613.1 N-acetyltransferase [Staphylococcus simiae]MBO1211771.1 N-acetyltransferase [Staphylococcus simiae]MBO1229847.1 N-acetyltransferase [Staphylococcus simiae]
MNHVKTYKREIYNVNDQQFIIEGPVSNSYLKSFNFDTNLTAFRNANDQFEALLDITTLDEGRIYIIHIDNLIIGYVTYHYPDDIERWSTGHLPYLIELGAIEVSINFRQRQLAEKLIMLSLSAPEYEDYIVITTEYYWHWDLKNSNLDVFEYKKIMQRLMATGGLEIFATDDPEITSHPANCLMARIGRNITLEQQQAFDDIRYMNRFFF